MATEDADLTKDPATDEADGAANNDEVRDALIDEDEHVTSEDIGAPPTAEELRKENVSEPAPDPLDLHGEKTVKEADTQGSDAIRAEYEAADLGTTTNLQHLGYQIAQFDSSGNNVLDALAFPSQGSLDAARAVEERQGIREPRTFEEKWPSTTDTTAPTQYDGEK